MRIAPLQRYSGQDLEALLTRGSGNGVSGLEIVDARFVTNREPHVRACAALWSPASGRVEAEALVKALLAEAQAHDAVLVRGATLVVGADIAARTIRPPSELPLGAVTAMLGVPFFLTQLRRLA